MIRIKKPPINKYLLLLICLLVNLGVIAQNSVTNDLTELNKTLLNGYAKDFDFSVLIEINDSIVFSEYFGYVDHKNLIPIDEKTLFNIASITKSITAAGIMKLVEKNSINLSDTLGHFFENVPEPKASISIQSLLSHRSGLGQTYPLDNISEADKALKVIFDQGLEFYPGSDFRYSNQNYQLLALIIEKVSQNTYENYIKTKVLSPLKMQDTYFWDEIKDRKELAPLNNRIFRSLGKRNWGFLAGTGVFTTTADLFKFWNGVFKKGFLSAQSVDIVLKPYYQTQSGVQIGSGFFKSPETKWNTPEIWTRGNESWGHNSVIRYFPEMNTTIIVSTNSGEIGKDKNLTGNRIISDLIADYLFK